MATKTPFLKLTKPLNNEYQDTWDGPMNTNSDLIDAWASAIDTEIFDARFGQINLKSFLEIGHNSDGTLKPTQELIDARNSFVFGDEKPSGDDFELKDHLQASDAEIFAAREGMASIRDCLAVRDFEKNEVVLGAKNANGYPTWLGFTGINVQIDGSVTTLWMKIGGLMSRIRNIKQIALSGGAGLKYLYADLNAIDGELVVDGDSTTAPPSSANGTIGSDGTKVRIFEDLTKDFSTENVRPGDVLEILGTTTNAGKYVITEVSPGGNNQRLKIKGIFLGGAMTGLDYNIWDPVGVTLGFDTANTVTPGRFYFGEADWDGSGITAVRTICFNDHFIGEWRGVDVSSTADYTETWNHNLFDDAINVHIQVSSTNDGSQPVEELSLGTLTNNLSVSRTNTLVLTPATPQVLSGDVTVSMAGEVYTDRSAYAKWTKYQITIKNTQANVFYRDYSGALKQTGYVRVVLSKVRK